MPHCKPYSIAKWPMCITAYDPQVFTTARARSDRPGSPPAEAAEPAVGHRRMMVRLIMSTGSRSISILMAAFRCWTVVNGSVERLGSVGRTVKMSTLFFSPHDLLPPRHALLFETGSFSRNFLTHRAIRYWDCASESLFRFNPNLRRNSNRGYPIDFPEVTASTQNVFSLSGPHRSAKTSNTKPNT